MENAANKETVILEAHQHWNIFVMPVFITILCFSIWMPLCVIGLCTLIYAGIRYATTVVIVSSKRVHGKYGILKVSSIDAPLTKVNDISVRKGLLGSIYDYGKLEIRKAGNLFEVNGISKPELIRNTILQAADDMEEGRFERQTRRYEEAIREQTMLQMHTGNQLANLLMNGIQEKHEGEENVLAITENEAPKRIENKAESKTENKPESKPERKVIEKKTNEKILWMDGAPILVHQVIISPLDEGQVSLKLEVQNLKKIHVEALYFDIQGFDVLKQEKCYLKEVPVLDLDIAGGEKLFLSQPLTLPDASIRRVKLYLRHVVFVNEEIWNGNEEAVLTQVEDNVEQIPRECYRDVEILCSENELLDSRPYVGANSCYPVFRKAYWICACGQFNTEKNCVVCHTDKELIRRTLAKQIVVQAHEKRLEEERIAEEKRLEEERIAEERRLAEEARMRAEAEERERLRKEEMRQRIEQVQNLFGSVKNGATKQLQSIKDGAIAQTENLREVVKRETEEIEKESRKKEEQLEVENSKVEADGSVCPECGMKNDADARFCVKCGKQLK